MISTLTALFKASIASTRPDRSCPMHALPKIELGSTVWVICGLYTACYSLRPMYAQRRLRVSYVIIHWRQIIILLFFSAGWRWVDSVSVGLQSSQKRVEYPSKTGWVNVVDVNCPVKTRRVSSSRPSFTVVSREPQRLSSGVGVRSVPGYALDVSDKEEIRRCCRDTSRLNSEPRRQLVSSRL